MVLKLRDDQVQDLAYAIGHPRCIFQHDPGVGKTPIVVVNQYRRATEGKRTIWVQPKHLMAKNAMEITRFTPLTEKDVVVVDGTPAKVDKAMNSGAQVMLMGPDRFKRLLPSLPICALDVDENHMCFGGAGARFDMRYGFVPSGRVQALYEYPMEEGIFMTGTIINGRLDNAFPAIHKIEPRYYPGGYDQFVAEHAFCDENNRVIAWHNHDRLGQILAGMSVRRTFEEVYGKQAVVFDTEWLEMAPEQRKIYDQFEEQAYLELDDFIINGTEPGVATIRARQIMEHPNRFRDLRDPYNLPHVDIMPGKRPAKHDALEVHFQHHNDRGTPVIVYHSLVPALEQIAELAAKNGRRVGLMHGEVPRVERNRIDLAFQRGELDTIVGSQPVCSVGYNWQFCGEVEVDHVINSALTYTHTDFSQGYKRAIRRARTKPLRVTTQAYLNSKVERRIREINVIKSQDAHKVDPTQEVIRFSSHEEVEA